MKSAIFLWMLLGFGSAIRLVASLTLTEAICFGWAPFLVFSELPLLRRHGVSGFFWLSILVVCGCALSSLVNHTPAFFVLRGMAGTAIIPCAIVVGHHILTRYPLGFKWYFVGVFISTLLTLFSKGLSVSSVTDPLYWVTKAEGVAGLLLYGYYMSLPKGIAPLLSAGLGLFCLKVTASGRAVALTFLGAAALYFLGGKESRKMKRISRNFWLILCSGIVVLPLVNMTYGKMARSGFLGEHSRRKYEAQTRYGNSLAQVIMGGRKESFIGLYAAIHKPIIGFGPWAMDYGGYTEAFFAKFGAPEDYADFIKTELARAASGRTVRMINCHSHIAEFWVWFGIFGLIFWIVVIYYMLRFVKSDVFAIPLWFGWLAGCVPVFAWHICFSPFAGRFNIPIAIVAMLLARAYRLGKWRTPIDLGSDGKPARRRPRGPIV